MLETFQHKVFSLYFLPLNFNWVMLVS